MEALEWNACSKNFVYNLGIGRGTSVLAIELSRPPPCKKGPIYFTQMRLLIVHQISCYTFYIWSIMAHVIYPTESYMLVYNEDWYIIKSSCKCP
ncbi:hypothetical protein HanRHA438_Chr10g0432281 [Helianthus annuus]|nr:hypothetical protein HanIR_Chr10g0452611 [Helianthus annuus]KAJ0698858.1 hypothetical protein HanOQP8_Chr10g0349311 [Helianthus annuus]KAJ0877779.1 hypothetical protein HanRHA438_Chr10g0432281 [Helianthus annuus]